MRRPIKRRDPASPDRIYNSAKVEKFLGYIMESGKKEIAMKIVYNAFDYIKEKKKEQTLLIFLKML